MARFFRRVRKQVVGTRAESRVTWAEELEIVYIQHKHGVFKLAHPRANTSHDMMVNMRCNKTTSSVVVRYCCMFYSVRHQGSSA